MGKYQWRNWPRVQLKSGTDKCDKLGQHIDYQTY